LSFELLATDFEIKLYIYQNPNDQAQISNKAPNPKPKNYDLAERTLKYFLFGILLEIGI